MANRQNSYRLTVVVDGISLGVWDDKTGGDSDSNSVQYFLGGGGPRISLGGTQQVANVVLQRLEDDVIRARQKWLYGRSGKGKAQVTQQPLDDENNPTGDPVQWGGRMKRFKISDVQSQANAAAQCEMEIEVDGNIS